MGECQVPSPVAVPCPLHPTASGHVPGGAGPWASTALPLQAIQRRLEEIEVTFRELEQKGIKLEKLLRDEDGKARAHRALRSPQPGGPLPHSCPLRCPAGSPADQKTQWMNQLLYLVQKKNSLMSEESDLMIT